MSIKKLREKRTQIERQLEDLKSSGKSNLENELNIIDSEIASRKSRNGILTGVFLLLFVTFLNIPFDKILSETMDGVDRWLLLVNVIETTALSAGIIIILYFVWLMVSSLNQNIKKKSKHKSLFEGFKLNILGMVAFYLVLVSVLTWIMFMFRSQEQFFFDLATAIIISWVVMVIIYYIWAIYFYNVNMGWEEEDWEELKRLKEKGEELPSDEPVENPHAKETLGLPPGTVRGTLAVSLLVAGLAMLIASFQLDQTYDSNSLFVDNFEFFKTAFLMMIAFYFGDKSIKALGQRNQGVYRPNGSGNGRGNSPNSGPTDDGEMGLPSSAVAVQAAVNPTKANDLTDLKDTLRAGESETKDDGDVSDFNVKGSVG